MTFKQTSGSHIFQHLFNYRNETLFTYGKGIQIDLARIMKCETHICDPFYVFSCTRPCMTNVKVQLMTNIIVWLSLASFLGLLTPTRCLALPKVGQIFDGDKTVSRPHARRKWESFVRLLPNQSLMATLPTDPWPLAISSQFNPDQGSIQSGTLIADLCNRTNWR